MEARAVLVNVKVDRKAVISNKWVKLPRTSDNEQDVGDLLSDTLQAQAPDYDPLPDGTDVVLH